MITRFEFLEQVYLPRYMGLLTEDYAGQSGVFDFKPTEPPVARIPIEYLTPRGVHIWLSQTGLCVIEHVLETGGFDMPIDEYRDLTMQGRLKIVALNQRFRKEVSAKNNLQGKMDLTRIRWGNMPMVKMEFDIANRAITGDLTGVLAPHPVPQTNTDIIRNP